MLYDGLGAALFVLGAGHFRPGAYHCGIRPPQVVVHFGNFQGGQELPLVYAVADIDVDLFDKSGDLRHHVHFLVRPEFGGQHQAVRQVLRGGLDDGHGRNVGRLHIAGLHGRLLRTGGSQARRCHDE